MKATLVLSTLALFAGAATADDIFRSSFESGPDGFAGTGDWQLGTPIGVNGTALGGFGGDEPIGGATGDFAWGTIIGGLHSPSTTSILSRQFSFAGFTDVAMSFAEWLDSGGNSFDQAKVFVNGDEVYFADGGPTNGWRTVNLDLSAYDGLADVTIEFSFITTSVVERVGWYVDDVAITGVPTPASAALLGFAGLAATRRRR